MRRELLLEVLRNLRAHAAQTLTSFLLCGAIGFFIVAAGASETAALNLRNTAVAERGLNIWRVQSVSSFPADSCEALAQVSGVRVAGSRSAPRNTTIPERPGIAVDAISATPGYIRITWSIAEDSILPQLAVGSEVAERLGLRKGSSITLPAETTDAHRVLIQQVLPPSQRVTGANQFLVIAATPTGLVTECLVEGEWGARSAVEAFLLSTFESPVTVSPLINDEELRNTPITPLGSRLSILLPILLPLLACVGLFLIQWGKRSEWSLYRILGVDRATSLDMLVVHTAVTVWAPYSLGATVGVMASVQLITADSLLAMSIVNDVTRGYCVFSLAPLVSSWALERRSGPLGWLQGQ